MKCDRRWWNDGALDVALEALAVAGRAEGARQELVDRASRIVRIARGEDRCVIAPYIGGRWSCPTLCALLPEGYRVVVIVTDAAGAFVGVSSNTAEDDTANLLRSALAGAERLEHAP